MVNDIVEGYFLAINNYISFKQENIKARINENYTNKLIKEASFIKMYAIIFSMLNNIFPRNLKSTSYSFNYEMRREFGRNSFRKSKIEPKTNKHLKKSVSDIEKSYHIPYNNSRQPLKTHLRKRKKYKLAKKFSTE